MDAFRGSRLRAVFLAVGTAAALALPGLAQENPAGDRPKDAERAPASGEGDSSSYRIEARIVLATDNDPGAPTLFGRYASAGLLSFVGIGEVQHGRYGATSLEGVKFGLLGHGEWKPGKLDLFHIYVDSGAGAEQERAIVRVLRAEPGLRARSGSFTFTKVAFEREGTGAYPTWRGTIGDRGTFSVNALLGGDGKNPVTVGNPFTLFRERDVVVLGTSQADFRDDGRELKWSVGSGETHSVLFSGALGPEDETIPPEPRKD